MFQWASFGITFLAAFYLSSGVAPLYIERQQQEAVAISKGLAKEGEQAPSLHDNRIFKIVTLGHWPASVDWLLIKTLANPKIDHVPEGQHADIFYLLDLATRLDPAFFELYGDGAGILSVVRNDNDGAITLLKRGEEFRTQTLPGLPVSFQKKYWSGQAQLPFLLGYIYLFEKGSPLEAKIHFEEAAKVPGVPDYLVGLAKRLDDPKERKRIRVSVLKGLLERKLEPQVEERIKKELRAEMESA